MATAAVGVQVDEAGHDPSPAELMAVVAARRWHARTDLDDVVAVDPKPAPIEHAGRIPPPGVDRSVRTGTDAAPTFRVDSQPPGAQVFVDGRLIGSTPVGSSLIHPGTHVLRIDNARESRWSWLRSRAVSCFAIC